MTDLCVRVINQKSNLLITTGDICQADVWTITVLKDSQEEKRQSVILLKSFLLTNIRGRSGA